MSKSVDGGKRGDDPSRAFQTSVRFVVCVVRVLCCVGCAVVCVVYVLCVCVVCVCVLCVCCACVCVCFVCRCVFCVVSYLS